MRTLCLYGNIDFIEISARGLPSSLTADNVSRYLSIRRLGPTGLINSMQMRYGLVKDDGFIEVWAFQRAFINGAKVAVLAQTARTELYIPDGFVKQTAAPSGYVESPVVRIYDQLNKPTKADLGLSNAMLTGAFGLGGSGIATTGKMSDVEILKALRDKGGHFWRGDKPTGSTATIYSHGSGIFSRCGDTWSAINIDYSTAKIKIYAGNDARLNNGTFSVNELYGSANKPSKSDVGLGNVTNDAQVKKTGDTMTGDLTIKKGTPSVFLRADSGVTALRFYTGDNTERGIIYAGPNTDSLGEVRIRAKTAGGTSGGDLVVRHDGRVEVRDLTVAYKIKSRTIEIANTDTDSSATTLSIYGVQHTPLVLTRSGSSENVSIGPWTQNSREGCGSLNSGLHSVTPFSCNIVPRMLLMSSFWKIRKFWRRPARHSGGCTFMLYSIWFLSFSPSSNQVTTPFTRRCTSSPCYIVR